MASKPGTLYYVEMGAWGLLNIDDPELPKQQRKQFLRAIQSELRNYNAKLHVTHYDHPRGRIYQYQLSHLGEDVYAATRFSEACRRALDTIKPSNPER